MSAVRFTGIRVVHKYTDKLYRPVCHCYFFCVLRSVNLRYYLICKVHNTNNVTLPISDLNCVHLPVEMFWCFLVLCNLSWLKIKSKVSKLWNKDCHLGGNLVDMYVYRSLWHVWCMTGTTQVINMKTCSAPDICFNGSLNIGSVNIITNAKCCSTDFCNNETLPGKTKLFLNDYFPFCRKTQNYNPIPNMCFLNLEQSWNMDVV